MARYEGCEEWLSAEDVQEELEEILDDEPWEPMYDELNNALREYVLNQYEAGRGGGRIPDGSDEFIAKVEEIIGYENEA